MYIYRGTLMLKFYREILLSFICFMSVLFFFDDRSNSFRPIQPSSLLSLVQLIGAITIGNIVLGSDLTDNLIAKKLSKSQLYTPWREAYQKVTKHKKFVAACPFCAQIAEADDARYFILKRTANFIVMLNFFPYSKGHLLIIPYVHIKDLKELSYTAQTELTRLSIESMDILKTNLHNDSFNIGMNLGPHSGASIPDHIHLQIIPRYEKEGLGFVQTVGQSSVISWDLKQLYEQLLPAFKAMILL